ncbi:hypothetical protein [Moraxella oblonga]|uniref:hypothetical protein n=1 Tax=Moraxella oblonga TaxID=200413 RepID=UPI00082D1C26|nr:hypothetical protein [Moraxella oblonga]
MSILFKTTKIAGVMLSLTLSSMAWAYSITITEPSEDRAYHRHAQNIEIEANISPALAVGDTSAILFDGKLVADGKKTTIPTADLALGEHTITAIVMDKNAQTIAKDERKVYVLQRNNLVKKKQEAIKKREEYEALPLHKKLYIGLRQDLHAPQDVDASTPTWAIK